MTYSLAQNNILQILLKYNSGETLSNTDHYLHRLKHFIDRQQPIEFLLPAFPGKSLNDQSVISAFPDRADYISFKTLSNLRDELQSIYLPGCKIYILHDGHFFYKTGCMRPFGEMDSYIKDLYATSDTKDIFPLTIYDFFSGVPQSGMLDHFYDHYVPDLSEVRRQTKISERARAKLSAKSAFFYNEFSSFLWPNQSRSLREKRSKIAAYQILAIEAGIAKLIEADYSDCFRLSIHQQHDALSKKFYINLMPQTSCAKTPWYHVLKEGRDGRFALIKKSDAVNLMQKFDKNNLAYYAEA